MEFRRYLPRSGNQSVFDRSTFGDNEFVYIKDRGGFAVSTPTEIGYSYNYNDYILENVPRSGVLLISDDNYADKYQAIKVHAIGSFEYVLVNDIYHGWQSHPYGAGFDIVDIQHYYNTYGDKSGFHWTGINKVLACQCSQFKNTIIGTNFDITGANPYNGWRKLFVNQESGDNLYLELRDKHSLESLVGIYGKNGEIYTTNFELLSDGYAEGFEALKDLEYIPKICFPVGATSTPFIQLVGGNEDFSSVNTKLKKISIRDFGAPYTYSTIISINYLSGLSEIELENCTWNLLYIRDTSIPMFDLASVSGKWKNCGQVSIFNNKNLTGFNIPYSGVGYTVTGDADYYSPYVLIGGEFDLRNNSFSADALNAFYTSLVDLTTITGVELSGINVSGNYGTGESSYDATIATNKGWWIK